jgi:DNA-binding beta-propeller fold protein YncE
VRSFFALVAACSLLAASPGTISTVAGTGSPGFSGDGGKAAAAQLDQPFDCCFGPRGEMYVADTNNHAIRRIDKSGIITTVAGCGRQGYSGDGGPATAATLNEPYGVAVDRDGTLYIVDRLNAAIRRVGAKTGVISTLAGTGTPGYDGDGGPANQARLREPNGLALDGRGGLLIADVADNRIRRVELETGTIDTIAGTGRREFSGDGGIAIGASIDGARAVDVDKDGSIYICEREGNRIRKIDASGIIHTVAGTGKAGYSGDGGQALQAAFNGPKWVHVGPDNAIYVVDTENHCVRRIDQKSGLISTIAGSGAKGTEGDGGPAASARMDRPHGCCVNRGMLYIADTNNHRIRACSVK